MSCSVNQKSHAAVSLRRVYLMVLIFLAGTPFSHSAATSSTSSRRESHVRRARETETEAQTQEVYQLSGVSVRRLQHQRQLNQKNHQYHDYVEHNDPRRIKSSKKSKYSSEAPSVSPKPSATPTMSQQPSAAPTAGPSSTPSSQPSQEPTISMQPSSLPSATPSLSPTKQPSSQPSSEPTISMSPSRTPTVMPSSRPSHSPSESPSSVPSSTPTAMPSHSPSHSPSSWPTDSPSMRPSDVPSSSPSDSPSASPSQLPSATPTVSLQPSATPTWVPSMVPSVIPSDVPTRVPSLEPTIKPTDQPSAKPSRSIGPSVTQFPTEDPLGFEVRTASSEDTTVAQEGGDEWTCRRSPPTEFSELVEYPILYEFEVNFELGTNIPAALSEGELLIGSGLAEIFCRVEQGDDIFYLHKVNSQKKDGVSTTKTCLASSADTDCVVVDGGITVTLHMVPGTNRRVLEETSDTVPPEIGAKFLAALNDILPSISQKLSTFRSTSVSAVTNLEPEPVVPVDNTVKISMAVLGCLAGVALLAVLAVTGKKRRTHKQQMLYYDDTFDFEDEDDQDTEAPSSPRKVAHIYHEEESVGGDSFLHAAAAGLVGAKMGEGSAGGVQFVSPGHYHARTSSAGTDEHIEMVVEEEEGPPQVEDPLTGISPQPSPISKRQMQNTIRELAPQPYIPRPSSVPSVNDTVDL